MNKAVISGVYADLKTVKTRSVCQVVVEVPIEHGKSIVDAFGFPQPGSEVHVAIARLNGEAGSNPNISADAPSTESPVSPTKRSFDELPYSQQAALKCQDAAFQKFITERDLAFNVASVDVFTNDPEERAKQITAEIVRRFCGVESRSEILPESDAGDKWNSLMDEYHLWQQDW